MSCLALQHRHNNTLCLQRTGVCVLLSELVLDPAYMLTSRGSISCRRALELLEQYPFSSVTNLHPIWVQAMPKPSNPAAAMAATGMTEEDALDAAIAQSLGLSQSPDEDGDYHAAGPDGAAPPPEAGVSFANIAKMGFAATGPKLSPGAPEMGELEPTALHGACAKGCMLCLVHRSVRVGVHACVQLQLVSQPMYAVQTLVACLQHAHARTHGYTHGTHGAHGLRNQLWCPRRKQRRQLLAHV